MKTSIIKIKYLIESEFTLKVNSDSSLFKALLVEKYKQVTQLARVPVSGSHWFESNLVYISFFFTNETKFNINKKLLTMAKNSIDYCVIHSSEKLYGVILQRLVDRYVNDKIERNMNVPYDFNTITAQGVEIDPGIFLPGEDSVNVTYTIRKDEKGTLFVYREYKQETVCSTVPVLILGYPTPVGLVDIIFNKYIDLNHASKGITGEVDLFRECFYNNNTIISF